MPLEKVTRLVSVREPIAVKDLEQVIPYSRARDLILKNPDHIVVLDCPCRSARANPCLPLDVCLIVGEPFASFVGEHHPERSRWITPEEAVEILHAEDERGHAHHAFFKDAMLGRFYAICNCCACCCGAIRAHRNGTPLLASSGYVSTVDDEQCIGCGDCNDFCQFFALTLTDGHAAIDTELCMGCGVCVSHCPQGALSLQRQSAKGEPLDIDCLFQALGRFTPA
jgi:Pyruvate/2-oxoacid:ferredoxin oxidoreductase delta subunit